uniref:tetratricopeptide repeat protein n=1 Tax=Prevotella disiens TaxID=28130 RepID=UPI00288C4349
HIRVICWCERRLILDAYNKGDLKRATELFEAIHKDAPDDLVVTYNLAYSYEKQGKTKEAILLYEQLAKSNNEQYKEIGKKAVKELKDK